MTTRKISMSAEELLTKGLKELGIIPSVKQFDSFMSYLALIKKWQGTYSLTSLRTDEDIIIKHFLDSCLYLSVLPHDAKSLADVGSGAGLPGIPIKIIRPELEVTLIEPSRKKAAFLRHVIRSLGLEGAEVIEAPVEAAGTARFDAAVTRALFTVKDFIKKASHIVKPDGILVMSKGPKITDELKNIKFPYEVKVLGLPFTDIKRNMVIIKNGQN